MFIDMCLLSHTQNNTSCPTERLPLIHTATRTLSCQRGFIRDYQNLSSKQIWLFWQHIKELDQIILLKTLKEKIITSSVYDCTVEDVEYIYNKLSIHIQQQK